MSKKLVRFTFDEPSLEILRGFTKALGFTSLAETVRTAVVVYRALYQQSQQGYSEVVVRNPTTNKERVIVIPSLETNQ